MIASAKFKTKPNGSTCSLVTWLFHQRKILDITGKTFQKLKKDEIKFQRTIFEHVKLLSSQLKKKKENQLPAHLNLTTPMRRYNRKSPFTILSKTKIDKKHL